MFVYKITETVEQTGGEYPLFTVGYFEPDGSFYSTSDHGGRSGQAEAQDVVSFLNGGSRPEWYNPTHDGS